MRSWFHKLRRKRRGGDPDDGAKPKPVPPAPNRASYYVPTRDRALLPWPPPRPATAREDNPKLRDTQFPRSPQPGDIVFDVVAARRDDRRFKSMPELKLRPIVTSRPPNAGAASPDSSSSSVAASPTARVRRRRFHHAPSSRRRKAAALPTPAEELRSSSWVYGSRVVVKDSADPEEDFLESMAEMMSANGVRSPRSLEELLACYLALNAPDHHQAIVAAFRRAWVHLHSAPPPPPPSKGRCMHESRLMT